MAQALTAFCDLQFCPVSFDFVTFLLRAKLEAGDRKLHIVIVPFESGLGGFGRNWGEHDEAATRWRLWHIVIPSCQLVGATVTLASSRKQAESLKADPSWWPYGKAHFMAPLVDAAKAGKSIPKLRATDAARRYVKQWSKKPYVTLTIRDQTTHPGRNSNRNEWGRLADSLRDRFDVVWLDDTHRALSASSGNFAQLDVDLRLALYEGAAMNYMGNNGPGILLQLSDAPYRIFVDKAWPDHWKQHFHLNVGDQLPWANDNQKWVYKPDTFENLRDA